VDRRCVLLEGCRLFSHNLPEGGVLILVSKPVESASGRNKLSQMRGSSLPDCWGTPKVKSRMPEHGVADTS
jgi:hypothetical protein